MIRKTATEEMKELRAALYARISTNDQSTLMQENELKHYAARRGWCIVKTYRDKGVSGARTRRPALDELFVDCRRGKIDVVLVWKFDRFARSLKQLVNALDLFRHLGINFVSCTEAVDTSVPYGELVFQIFGAIAQFERVLIGERVKAGLAHARSRGKVLGRPPLQRLTTEEIRRIARERERRKLSYRALAKQFGISVWTAHKLCRHAD